MKPKEVVLTKLELGIKMYLTDRLVNEKFTEIESGHEWDYALRATEFVMIAKALGETLGEIQFPAEWQKFVKRKDCPKYMKRMKTIKVDAYYPKLSFPEEEHWVTFRKTSER